MCQTMPDAVLMQVEPFSFHGVQKKTQTAQNDIGIDSSILADCEDGSIGNE